jgi:hypothetical protein
MGKNHHQKHQHQSIQVRLKGNTYLVKDFKATMQVLPTLDSSRKS